ncbi:hypothetical protein L4D77_14210 [Photobacterium frigidiphilum]|uniref:hypothetical protein n=1 Tax=Photobacterium frigidiphilum TaxID=264736 RepID=UPI003D14BFB7
MIISSICVMDKETLVNHQHESMRTLELNATLWNTNIQHMIRLMDKKQTAITQETMVARSLPLTTININ